MYEFPIKSHTKLTMYYIIRLLLYDIITVTLRISHSFSLKCISYNTKCIDAVMQSNLMGTDVHRFVTNSLRRETMTKS